MRLTIDLRFQAPAVVAAHDERVVALGDLARMTLHPRRLIRLLRDPGIDEMLVLRDERALNGVQAGALAIAALGSAGRVEIRSPSNVKVAGRGKTRIHALVVLAVALPLELARSGYWLWRARRAAATSFSLPAFPLAVKRVTYLRGESSLRWLGSQVGGAATHTAGVINGLTNAGIEVNVFAPERPEGIRSANCEAIPPKYILQLVHWLTRIGHGQALVSAAARTPADFVYQRYALGSYAGLDLAQRLGVPLVLEFNSSEVWTERNWGSGRLPLAKVLVALERRNLRDASLIVVISQPLKGQLIREGFDPARVLVNPNGVDVGKLADVRSQTAAQWRSQTGSTEAPTVGFVGTFGLWHGVKLLPEMVQRVAALNDDARWILIGDGPLHAEVAAEIDRRGLSERVLMTGLVPHDNAVEMLACCEVCVSPHVPNPDGTAFFGSPTKLFEYMGLARAIVASDLDQIGEVLEDGRNALLTTPGDPTAAAIAVAKLLKDDAMRARLGQAALEDAIDSHTWDAHVLRTIEALTAKSRHPSADIAVVADR